MITKVYYKYTKWSKINFILILLILGSEHLIDGKKSPLEVMKKYIFC